MTTSHLTGDTTSHSTKSSKSDDQVAGYKPEKDAGKSLVIADRAAIAKIIPHARDMCLLEGVLECDARHIRCVSRTHLDPQNPLRSEQGLLALCGIEYAAQAMAIHGGMSGQINERPRAGYLASLRDVAFYCERLDTLTDELIIEAEKLMGDEARAIYQFRLQSAGQDVLSGRATVVLDAVKAAA